MSSTAAATTTVIQQRIGSSISLWEKGLVTTAYAVYLCFIIPFHEPWADEAQAWQLARSVPIVDLFRTHLRYEGTPGLWHFILAILTRMHVPYTGLNWFAGAVAFTGVAFLIFCSPFPRYVRFALPFTFFLAFQYAVVARSYVLVPTLLFATAMMWRRSPILVAVGLGLLGNVSLHALAISGGFALTYLVENKQRWSKQSAPRYLEGAGILLAFYLLAILTVLPRPADLNFSPWPSSLRFSSTGIRMIILTLRGLSPFTGLVGRGAMLLLAFPCWIYLVVRFLRAGLWAYGLPVLMFALFSFYYCNFWHMGLLVPTLIAICWITWPQVTAMGIGAEVPVLCVIALQIGWTFHAVHFDVLHDYSPDAAAARYLAPRLASGDEAAVTYLRHPEVNAFHSVGLAPYFDRQIFLNQPRPFWLWSKNEHTDAQFLTAFQRHPAIVVAVYYRSKSFDPPLNLDGDRAVFLKASGYRLMHTFCAEKPEDFREREEICYLIFERKAVP